MNRAWVLGLGLLLVPMANLVAQSTVIFSITNSWRYNQTANLDGVNWMATSYNDASWPSGRALLYVETNTLVSPRNTALTIGRNTYYFRTHFNYTNTTPNMVLTFSNKVDDGAVFYLNGREIQRIRVSQPPAIIYYSTGAISEPASGDATEWDVFSIPATNAVSGDNVLAVEVHQIWPDSDDIVFGSALSIAPMSVNRGPFLQLVTTNSIVVRWRTDLPTNSIVHYGTNLASLDETVSSSTIANDHEHTLSGLTPDTKYYYSVGCTSRTLAGGDTNHFFFTAPLPGTIKPLRIWVLGDSGTADAKARALKDAYFNYTGTRQTDLWLMLGDNAYLYGADPEYQAAVFMMYPELLRRSVLWPALGNHETNQRTNFVDTYPFFGIFTLPTNGIAGGTASGTEHYFSFDYANVHFVCLDSMTASRATNGTMANWLRTDMNTTTQMWKIAYWHHPPYSKGSHDSDEETELIEMRQNILPILEERGIDLVLAGHSHVYERSYLLDGHYGYSWTLTTNMILNAGSGRETNALGPYTKAATGAKAHQGAVYAVLGSSGSVSGGSLNHPAMYFSEAALGSMVIDIDNDRLNAKFLRETGAIDDEFTIVKRNPKFSAEQFVGSSFRLSLTNIASKKTNIIQASSTLTNWSSLKTNVVTSNSFQYTDTTASNFNYRFYRLLRLP